jgi:hypothetical protein
MLVGAYGTFWEASLIDWRASGWRMLGRQGVNIPVLRIADFRKARGVYALYSDTGIYYVGLAAGTNGIGGRLKDHRSDIHAERWSRFSWFAFDGPSETVTYADGVLKHDEWASIQEAEGKLVIREMEALLLAVTSPPGNISRTKFQEGSPWVQVADHTPPIRTFASLRHKVDPQAD